VITPVNTTKLKNHNENLYKPTISIDNSGIS